MKITTSAIICLTVLVAISNGCVSSQDFEEVPFEEMTAGPPCITGSPDGIVIRSEQDYQNIRKKHAQQGPYVYFEGDGVQRSFTLPYLVVDANDDGMFGPEEFILYLNPPEDPDGFYISHKDMKIYSRPFHISDGKIQIYKTTYPYTREEEKAIPYEEIFTIDPKTGTITFTTPLQKGQKLSLGASKALLDEEISPMLWQKTGRKCSMTDRDFSKKTILGKTIRAGGCGVDFNKNVQRDDQRKKVIYTIQVVEHGNCKMGFSNDNWISTEKIPADYQVDFVVKKKKQ